VSIVIYISDMLQLRAACLRLLAAYVFEADRTFRLLMSFKNFPITLRNRLALFDQRQKENDAYQDYQSARAKLFELALGHSWRQQKSAQSHQN
jgi:hypothetical protein